MSQSDKPFRILVTGPNGFVGSHLLSYIEKLEGYEGIALPRYDIERLADTKLLEFFKDVDAVVHLAGRAHKFGIEAENAAAFTADNVNLTNRILKLTIKAKVKRFVFASTIGVHGSETTGFPITENSPFKPDNPYTRSKRQAEKVVVALCSEAKTNYVIVRPPLIIGEDAKGNVAKLKKFINTGLPIPLGSVKNKRSILFVETFCRALVEISKSRKSINETFVLSEESDFTTAEIIREIARRHGLKARLMRCPLWLLNLVGKITGQSKKISQLTSDLQVDAHKYRTLIEKG